MAVQNNSNLDQQGNQPSEIAQTLAAIADPKERAQTEAAYVKTMADGLGISPEALKAGIDKEVAALSNQVAVPASHLVDVNSQPSHLTSTPATQAVTKSSDMPIEVRQFITDGPQVGIGQGLNKDGPTGAYVQAQTPSYNVAGIETASKAQLSLDENYDPKDLTVSQKANWSVQKLGGGFEVAPQTEVSAKMPFDGRDWSGKDVEVTQSFTLQYKEKPYNLAALGSVNVNGAGVPGYSAALIDSVVIPKTDKDYALDLGIKTTDTSELAGKGEGFTVAVSKPIGADSVANAKFTVMTNGKLGDTAAALEFSLTGNGAEAASLHTASMPTQTEPAWYLRDESATPKNNDISVPTVPVAPAEPVSSSQSQASMHIRRDPATGEAVNPTKALSDAYVRLDNSESRDVFLTQLAENFRTDKESLRESFSHYHPELKAEQVAANDSGQSR